MMNLAIARPALPAREAPLRHLHAVPPAATEPETPVPAAPQPTAPAACAPAPTGDSAMHSEATASDLLPTAAHVLQLLVDIQAGTRPAHQAMHWTDPAVYRALLRREQRIRSIAGATLTHQRHAAESAQHAVRGHVQSVRVCRLSEDRAEISAVVWHTDSRGRQRAGALAVRIDQRDGQWRATAVEAA